MSKEEFKEHKNNANGQQKAIKLGYDRIKTKAKKNFGPIFRKQ